MKKIISLILIVSLCVSLGVMFTACSNSTTNPSDPSTPANEKYSGWLLPTRLTASDDTAFDLVWTENSCMFTVEKTTYTFTYNTEKRSLNIFVDGGTDYSYEDLCVFDADDRITEVHIQGRTMLKMSYADDKMTVLAFGEENATPVEIFADWNEHKVQMPPFNNPEDFLYFTEWGDLYAGEGTTLYNYQYDARGNIESITMSDIGDYSWSLSYGEEAMTKAWQRTVIKFLLVWTLGRPLSVFAMDMMCFGLYQQHNEK